MGRYYRIFTLIGCIFLSVSSAFGEEDRLYTKDEIVASIPSEKENEKDWELKYAISLPEFPALWEYFVTLHIAPAGNRPDRLSIYRRVNSEDSKKKGYRLIKRMFSEETRGFAYFGNPSFFTYSLEGGSWYHFIHVPMFYSGTGHHRKDKIFRIKDGELDAIEFEPAPVWFKSKLKKGEGVKKGEYNHFSHVRLYFSFLIWNQGDGNCSPTAGVVKGTYKIICTKKNDVSKEPEKLKMLVDKYERLPIEY